MRSLSSTSSTPLLPLVHPIYFCPHQQIDGGDISIRVPFSLASGPLTGHYLCFSYLSSHFPLHGAVLGLNSDLILAIMLQRRCLRPDIKYLFFTHSHPFASFPFPITYLFLFTLHPDQSSPSFPPSPTLNNPSPITPSPSLQRRDALLGTTYSGHPRWV